MTNNEETKIELKELIKNIDFNEYKNIVKKYAKYDKSNSRLAGKKWTGKQDSTLIYLYWQAMNHIAKKTGRSTAAIVSRLMMHGYSIPKDTITE